MSLERHTPSWLLLRRELGSRGPRTRGRLNFTPSTFLKIWNSCLPFPLKITTLVINKRIYSISLGKSKSPLKHFLLLHKRNKILLVTSDGRGILVACLYTIILLERWLRYAKDMLPCSKMLLNTMGLGAPDNSAMENMMNTLVSVLVEPE